MAERPKRNCLSCMHLDQVNGDEGLCMALMPAFLASGTPPRVVALWPFRADAPVSDVFRGRECPLWQLDR